MVKRTVEQQLPTQGVPEPLPESIYSSSLGLTIRTRWEDSDDDDASVSTGTADKKKPVYTIITADLLIPGDGEPQADAALVIEGTVIDWVGTQSTMPSKYTSSPHKKTYSVPYLMPGLWDCHVHFGGESTSEPPTLPLIGHHPASSGARLAKGCWTALQRGYTSLRDVAGFGCEVALAIDDGTIAGPHVYGCGAALSQTGGHGDVFELPAGDTLSHMGVGGAVTPGMSYGGGKIVLADGVDECRRAVRLQVRRGARCIKVFASGGVKSRGDALMAPQFSPEELECVVAEAARPGLAVAAHLHSKEAIVAAVRAGVRTVEHASFADEECVELIREKGCVYVATRTVVVLLLKTGGKGLPRRTWEKALLVGRCHEDAYKRAVRAGAVCALGTDTQPGFNMALELEYAVAAGMSNLEAIKAATANGPLCLGDQAPRTGQLKVGYDADVIGLVENPVEDVKVLQKIDNVRWVWKSGKIFKGPGVGPWGEE